MIAQQSDLETAEKGVVQERPETTRWLRVLGGVALFLHALAHTLPGMLATERPQPITWIWVGTLIWGLTAISFVSASYGLWGFAWFSKRWRFFALVGVCASILLFAGPSFGWAWPGILIDLALAAIILKSDPVVPHPKERGRAGRAWAGFVRIFALLTLAYGAATILLRPWHQYWGATTEDVVRAMPGDKEGTGRLHSINHVVTINAPPEKVWPWLVQLGQDKAGFYSYDWLERAIGDDIHNVYRIVPEFQHLKEGDLVRAVQPGYMGGRFGDSVGWQVDKVVPNRLLLLRQWGAFWLEPLPGGKTRFGVRSQIGDVSFWAAPLEVFGFEPMHFIMEQKMLLTIKALAEGEAL